MRHGVKVWRVWRAKRRGMAQPDSKAMTCPRPPPQRKGFKGESPCGAWGSAPKPYAAALAPKRANSPQGDEASDSGTWLGFIDSQSHAALHERRVACFIQIISYGCFACRIAVSRLRLRLRRRKCGAKPCPCAKSAVSAAVSRVLSLDGHLSSPRVAARFMRSPRGHDGQPYRPHSDLASGGVYIVRPLPAHG